MINLREQVESDLSITLEGNWALPVELTDPDGVKTTTSVTGDLLVGQILYDIVKLNPETGEEMVVNKPVVTLRRTSLTRVPQSGENWFVRIPIAPSLTAPKEDFVLDPTKSTEGGASIGFIRLYLRRAQQS